LSKVINRHFQKLTGSINSFNAKLTADAGKFTVWHIHLKLSKEMVLAACLMLDFLDLITDLEELIHDAPLEIIPKIDAMIDECQDAILDNTSAGPGGGSRLQRATRRRRGRSKKWLIR
jgi:hypothetical protein